MLVDFKTIFECSLKSQRLFPTISQVFHSSFIPFKHKPNLCDNLQSQRENIEYSAKN